MRKLTYILLLICSVGLGQETMPYDSLNAYGITFYESLYDIPDSTDAAHNKNVYYFDGDAVSNGTGTRSNPYNTLSGITFADSTTYAFKRGSYLDDGGVSVAIDATSVFLTDYGAGNRPVISTYTFELKGTGGAMKSIKFDDIPYNDVWIGDAASAADSNYFIYDCEFNINPIEIWGSNVKVIRSVIHGQPQDGIFFQDNDNGGVGLEIAYCAIYDVNQDFFVNGVSPDGDAIQLSTFWGAHIHHNYISRFGTGNKFALIMRDEAGFWTGSAIPSTIEDNVFILQSETQDAWGANYGGSGIYIEEQQAAVIRRNRFYGHGILNSFYIATASSDNHIYGNLFENTGGAFYSFGADNIYNNTFISSTDTAKGNLANTYAKNNLFTSTINTFDDGTNLSIATEGATNLFTDYANGDYTLKSTAVAVDSATYEVGMQSFTQDVDSNIFVQTTGTYSIGYDQSQSAVAEQTDSLQANFSNTDVLWWKTLNPASPTVTNGSITLTYDGTSSFFDGYTNGVYPDAVAQKNMGSSSQDSMYVVIEADSAWIAVEFYFSLNAGQERLVDIYANGTLLYNDFNLNQAQILYDTLQVGDSLIITMKPVGGSPDVAMNAIRVFQIEDQPEPPPTPPVVVETVAPTFGGKLLSQNGLAIIPSFNPNFVPCTVCGVLDFDGVDDYVSFSPVPDATGEKFVEFDLFLEKELYSTINGLGNAVFVIRNNTSDYIAVTLYSNYLQIITTNSGFGNPRFDITGLSGKTIKIRIEKNTSIKAILYIDNVLQTESTAIGGTSVSFDNTFHIGEINSLPFLEDAYVFNFNFNDEFFAPGQPNGNQTSAWSNGIYNATVNGSPTTIDLP